jgi:uncharacterized protein YjiS (DUF1127 family)
VNYLINIIRFTYTPKLTYSQYSLRQRPLNSQILIGAIMTTYTQNCTHGSTANTTGILDSLAQLFRQWMDCQLLKIRIQHERKALLSMSSAMLRDIGISHADADQEALRTDLPADRLN